jgi:hypothetical protein
MRGNYVNIFPNILKDIKPIIKNTNIYIASPRIPANIIEPITNVTKNILLDICNLAATYEYIIINAPKNKVELPKK